MDITPPTPPPIPPREPGGGDFFRGCARYAWISVLIAIVWNIVFTASQNAEHASRQSNLFSAAVVGLLMVTGLIAGIIGLCGIPGHGWRKLLLPSLTGMALWLVLASIAVPAFMNARAKALALKAKAAEVIVLQPVRHIADAKPFRDEALGIAFDIPEGFKEMDEASLDKAYKHGFFKPAGSGLNNILCITPMKQPGVRGLLSPSKVSQKLKDRGVTLGSSNWRGVEVNAFRVPENIDGVKFVTYNVQIPLKKEAVQLSFGGPAEAEEAVRARVSDVLGSLEADPN